MKNISFRPWMAWFLAGLITFAIGLQIRLYPLFRNVSSDAYEEGTLLVINRIRTMITAQVNAQYPAMPASEKTAFINARLNETLRKENTKIREAFEKTGYEILQRSGNNKHYLLASDGYYFLNLTENILNHGDVSEKVNGSRYFNKLMLAPVGYWEPQTWHPYVGALVTRAIRIFAPDTDTMSAVAWTSITLLPFAVAAFLFACYSIGCSLFPAFTTSVFFVMTPIYVKRSTYAWYDNDSYAVIFPALALGFLFMALRTLGHTKKFLVYSALCAISLAIYSMFWSGWGYLWALTVVAAICVTLKSLFLKDPRVTRLSAAIGALLLLTTILVAALIGFSQISSVMQAAWGELQKFTAPQFKSWPDLFIAVGELKKGSLHDIIELSGGPLAFFGAITALVFSLSAWIFKRTIPSDEIIVLGIFAAVTVYLGNSAQRFIILCIVPFLLLFAYGLERLWMSRKKMIRSFKWNKSMLRWAEKLILALMVLSIIVPILTGQHMIRSLLNPIFNSAWDRALTKLEKETPANSIINTWWTPGHFVKAIARRAVTFDGASIKGEQAYWLTKVYLARDERAALGILRMLNTSSNNAAEYLQKMNLPLSTIVPLLLEITQARQDQARQALLKVFPEATTNELLRLTHGIPPPSYLMIYNEIAENNPLLGYVGKWDFAGIEKLNQNPAALRQIPARSSPGYTNFLWSLVGGPFRESPTLSLESKGSGKELFANGVTVNTSNMTAQISSPTFGQGIPTSLVYLDPEKNKVVEKVLPDANLSYSIVYFKDNGIPKTILMDRVLANSLIVKLYYFEGQGLEYFKPFTREQDLTGRTKIYIYEIKWPADL